MRFPAMACLLFLLVAGTASADPTPQQDGETLYRTHCAACHGALETTRVPNRSPERIASAIRVFPAMNPLKILTDDELKRIAEVLRTR